MVGLLVRGLVALGGRRIGGVVVDGGVPRRGGGRPALRQPPDEAGGVNDQNGYQSG